MAKSQKKKAVAKKTRAIEGDVTMKKLPSNEMARKPATKRLASGNIGMKKEYLKSTNMCKVTFRLSQIAAPDANSVCIVGEFNDWNIYANPMRKLKNGNYTVTVELKPGREYQFGYLIDESKWVNDWNADKNVKSPYGDSDNSVVVV